MMGRKIVGKLFFISWIALSAGCADKEDAQLIDQNYMQSDHYSNFQNNSREEMAYNEKNKKSFTENLRELIKCSGVEEVSLPFQLDLKFLDQLRSSSPESCMVEALQKPSYSVQLLAKHSLENLQLHWLLLNRPSVYRNQGIFIAIIRNDSLLDFTSVGSFEEDLSKEVTSSIRVEKIKDEIIISTTTRRNISYPFEQENTVNKSFFVTPEGDIKIQKPSDS